MTHSVSIHSLLRIRHKHMIGGGRAGYWRVLVAAVASVVEQELAEELEWRQRGRGGTGGGAG